MLKFISVMIYVSTILAIAATGVFYIGILLKNASFTNPQAFSVCNNQIKVCRVSSVVFVVVYWFMVSGLPIAQCWAGYQSLSVVCSKLGCAWIVFAFVNIVISIILGIQKRGRDEILTMGRFRNSSFVMGAFLLLVAFILEVN